MNMDNSLYTGKSETDVNASTGSIRQCVQLKHSPSNYSSAETELKPIVTDCQSAATYECEIPKAGVVVDSKCPEGYMHFYDRCYKFVKESIKWDEAQEVCVQEGG